MQLSPGLFRVYDNHEELTRIDGEMFGLMKKRAYNLIIQIVLTITILFTQIAHIFLNHHFEIDAGNWMWGYTIAVVLVGIFFIWRGKVIGLQVKDKIDEFFEAMKNGKIDPKKLSFPIPGNGDVDDTHAEEE